MRLAFCLFRYFPFSGLARDMLRIADCALERGHQVHIFTSEWRGEPSEAHHTEILPASGATNHGRTNSFHRALRARLNTDFDVVVGFNKIPGLDVYYAADPCFAARARYSRPPLYRLTPRYRGYRQLEYSVFSRNTHTHVLVLSENARSEFQEFYGTQDSRFTILPPTLRDEYRDISLSAESRTRIRREIGISDDEQVVLMVGSGFRTKGVDRAIRAMAAVAPDHGRRPRLLIAGDGKAEPYRALARSCGVQAQITFLGGRTDVPELMAAADVLLHPAYNENTGAVLLEAMAVGLPVLTTDVCGYARYVIDAGAGCVLQSPFNQQSLDTALDAMLRTEPSTWRRNGTAYTQRPLFYSMPDKAVDIIENNASSGRHRGRETGNFIYLSERLHLGQAEATLDGVLSLSGETFRQAPGRRTLRFVRQGTGYFLKKHNGVGWREIAKNLVSLKLPVLGAQNEWHALHVLRRKGVKTPAPLGFGTRGRNPARRKSFVIMEEIADSISLEQLFQQKGPSNDVSFKRNLISMLAGITRTLHLNGVNHRDFYLCHFLIDKRVAAGGPGQDPVNIILIDLHRAQIRRTTPMRWIVKDLGGLYYSAMDIDLSRNDLFRFIRTYCGQPLRTALEAPVDWGRVEKRALGLYQSDRAAMQ